MRVNAVAPGFIETQAAERLIERLAANAGTDVDEARQGLMDSLGGIPMGRPGQPDVGKTVRDVVVPNRKLLSTDRMNTSEGRLVGSR